MQVSALRSISRCYRLGLRRPTRAFPVAFAPARPRRANRGITSSAAAGGEDEDGGGTAVEEKKGGHGKGKRDLADAYMEVRDMLTDPSRLVRAVASGKAKGADPEWRRLEMFPVALKGGVKLQVVKYDERQAFTSNHVYAGADAVRVPGTPGTPRGCRLVPHKVQRAHRG